MSMSTDSEHPMVAGYGDHLPCTCGPTMRPGGYDPNCPIDGEVTEVNPEPDEKACPVCGQPIYRTLEESFGATGSIHSAVQWRHAATGRIACPPRVLP